jgi:hypothetical protein
MRDHLVHLNEVATLARIHQRAETSNGLAADACRKVTWSQFVRSRWRSTWLPDWLAEHALRQSRHNSYGRYGTANAEALIELLGRLLARREGRSVK